MPGTIILPTGLGLILCGVDEVQQLTGELKRLGDNEGYKIDKNKIRELWQDRLAVKTARPPELPSRLCCHQPCFFFRHRQELVWARLPPAVVRFTKGKSKQPHTGPLAPHTAVDAPAIAVEPWWPFVASEWRAGLSCLVL